MRGIGTFDSSALPDPQTFHTALSSFFTSSGKLFHAFSIQQSESLYNDVFSYSIGPFNTASVGRLCAIAAVGCYYSDGKIPQFVAETLYDIAKYLLDDVVEEDATEAAKCCLMLAMYNIVDRPTVALTSIGMLSYISAPCERLPDRPILQTWA